MVCGGLGRSVGDRLEAVGVPLAAASHVGTAAVEEAAVAGAVVAAASRREVITDVRGGGPTAQHDVR